MLRIFLHNRRGIHTHTLCPKLAFFLIKLQDFIFSSFFASSCFSSLVSNWWLELGSVMSRWDIDLLICLVSAFSQFVSSVKWCGFFLFFILSHWHSHTSIRCSFWFSFDVYLPTTVYCIGAPTLNNEISSQTCLQPIF